MDVDAELVLDARCELAECPVWDDGAGLLRWVDIGGHRVHHLHPTTGDHGSVDVGRSVSALATRADDDGLVLAVRDGFAAGDGTLLVPVEVERAGSRMNDGACDARGRFWAGTMADDLTPGAGTLYRLDPDGTVHAVLGGVTLSNGLAWTDDGATMLYVDSATYRVDAFAYDLATGTLDVESRRTVIEVPAEWGMPDGIALDRDGGLWVAICGGGRVCRFDADGWLDVTVRVPATRVTSCAFGGPDLDVLYITTASDELTPQQAAAQPLAGGIFRHRTDRQGHPANRYG
jgi:sugar lactone lactonase YvrE